MSIVTKYNIHIPDALVFIGVLVLAGTALFSPTPQKVAILVGGAIAAAGYLWARFVG